MLCFSMLFGSVGSKSRLAKATGTESCGEWTWKNCTPLWREAHFQVKMLRNWQSRGAFGSSDVEKLHADVARSTFASQNVKNTPFPDHFLKFSCQKIPCRCSEKHISKSNFEKTHHVRTTFGREAVEKWQAAVARSTFEVALSKNCTRLWREANLQLKMCKTHHVRATFSKNADWLTNQPTDQPTN